MTKAKASRNNNIVFVNSFKGGTGKTSISLSLCVSAALRNKNQEKYDKIFYFDIDILGTGSYYKLFPEEIEIEDKHYFNDYDKKLWYEFSREINIEVDGQKGLFYALCVNPNLRIKKTNYENTTIKVNSIPEEIFIGSVIHFITESSKVKADKPNLYIFDCSPGFNRIERELILKLNEIKKKSDYDVKEVFVTSYDSSHVEKTVECLKVYFSTKKPLEVKKVDNKKINQYIVLNDIHDLPNIKTKENEKINLNFDTAKTKIQELFNSGEKKLDYNKLYNIFETIYKRNMCVSNLLTRKVGLKSSCDDYNITNSSLYNEVVDYDNTEK